jgi:hypothetical protein
MPSTGQEQGFCKIVGGTATAFCRVCTGGSFGGDAHANESKGIGDQMMGALGTVEVELSGLNVKGVSPTDLAYWCPTTPGAQVASFPDFLFALDGSGGAQWTMADCQPGSFAAKMDADLAAQLEFTLSLKGIPTAAAAKAKTPLYTSLRDYGRRHVSVLFDTSNDYDCLSFDLGNDLAPEAYDPLRVRTVGHLSEPLAYYTKGQTPRLRATLGTAGTTIAAIMADTQVVGDVIIACRNGVDAPLVFTCVDFYGVKWTETLTPDGIAGVDIDFQPGDGTISNRIQIATGS